MIPNDYLSSVCQLGQREKTCAFLVMHPDGFQCAKGTRLESRLRTRLQAGNIVAKGDNCPGWEVVREC